MRDGGAWRQKCGGGDREQSQGLKKEGKQGQRCGGPGGRTPRDRANHLWAENHKLEVRGCGQKAEGEEEAMARGKEITAERVRQSCGREAESEVEREQSQNQTEEQEEGGRGQPWLGCAGPLPGPPREQVGAAPTWLPAPCAGSVLQGHTEGRGPGLCKTRHVCLLRTQQ